MQEEQDDNDIKVIVEDEDNQEEEAKIALTRTDDNFALVLKYYLQWLLLILIHISVFWWFPNKVNIIVQGHSYCDFEDLDTRQNCNEVRMNWALIVFYLLYCVYFFFSAL